MDKAERDLEAAFEKRAAAESALSESGIVAAEASLSVWRSVELFRRLQKEGASLEAACSAAIRDFSARMAALRNWIARGA